MSNDKQPTPEGKPMTAEEILNNHYANRATKHLPLSTMNNIILAMEAYAAQQTATLRQELKRRTDYADGKSKEVAALREELQFLEKLADRWLNGQTDAQLLCDEKDARIKELNEELERAKGRIDYYRDASDKKDITIEKQDVSIKELEEITRTLAEGRDDRILEIKEQDARIKELESQRDSISKACERWANKWATKNDQYIKIKEELEAVKKERDETVNLLLSIERIIDHQGSKSAHNVPSSLISFSANVVVPFLSRVASGERKSVSPWISVEDRLPIVGERYNFINDITHSPHYGEVFGGKYMGERFGYHEFGLPGHSMTAKYYCPIPAPPESLTDKTE